MLSPDTFTWYAQRLRSMDPAEVAWRASRSLRARGPRPASVFRDDSALFGGVAPDWEVELEHFRAAADRPVVLTRVRAAEIAAEMDPTALVEAADKVAELRFRFFGYPEVELPVPLDWNYDPISQTRWPKTPARLINHRTAAGDPKWVWELNRLQHLPLLAVAWLVTGEERYSRAAFEQLDSWLRQNPPGCGIAWRGAFEAGLRAMSVAVALDGFKDSAELTPERFREAVRMLEASAAYCWSERSRYSSANNHLVGELAGLATVAVMFPRLARASTWERRAVQLLGQEADRQLLSDGAGAEQAVGYQVFTAELLLVVACLLRRRDGATPQKLTDAVVRSARYLAGIVGDRDPAPRYGDDDEGFALRLGPEPTRTVREHLAIVGGFTADATLSALGSPSFTACWFTDHAAQGEAAPPAPSWYAAEGGLVVLRSRGRRITMDVGALGYLAIAAHGHADALALTVSQDGVELIGDPGAASYYGHPEWRRTHRGTRVHATVCVDGRDQSDMGGPFLWTRHAAVRVNAVDLDAGLVDAEHTGYQRLAEPVTHRRWLVAPPDSHSALVVDLLTGQGTHDAVGSWPLPPTMDAARVDAGHRVDGGAGPVLDLRYAATEPLTLEEARGELDSGLGWWSTRLEQREPAWLLGAHAHGTVPMALATLLTTGGPPPEIEALSVSLSDRHVVVGWQDNEQTVQVEVERWAAGAVSWRVVAR